MRRGFKGFGKVLQFVIGPKKKHFFSPAFSLLLNTVWRLFREIKSKQ